MTLGYNLKKEEDKLVNDRGDIKKVDTLTEIEKKRRKNEKKKRLGLIKKAKREYKESLKFKTQKIKTQPKINPVNDYHTDYHRTTTHQQKETKNREGKNASNIKLPKNTENKHIYEINRIAETLKWSVSKVQILVKQKTGIKEAVTLNYNEYHLCKDMFESRRKALQKQEKLESQFKSIVRSSNRYKRTNKSAGVWDRISKYGPGKIIYIRSK